MLGKFVCLSVMSYASGAVCVAQSRTPTAVFKSMGLSYMHPTLPPFPPMGSLGGGRGLSCQVTELTSRNEADPPVKRKVFKFV